MHAHERSLYLLHIQQNGRFPQNLRERRRLRVWKQRELGIKNLFAEYKEKYSTKYPAEEFKKDREAINERAFLRHIMAYRIQQYWHRCRTDPNYALCRKKINRDYDDYMAQLN